jgi:hypothetical protein
MQTHPSGKIPSSGGHPVEPGRFGLHRRRLWSRDMAAAELAAPVHHTLSRDATAPGSIVHDVAHAG